MRFLSSLLLLSLMLATGTAAISSTAAATVKMPPSLPPSPFPSPSLSPYEGRSFHVINVRPSESHPHSHSDPLVIDVSVHVNFQKNQESHVSEHEDEDEDKDDFDHSSHHGAIASDSSLDLAEYPNDHPEGGDQGGSAPTQGKKKPPTHQLPTRLNTDPSPHPSGNSPLLSPSRWLNSHPEKRDPNQPNYDYMEPNEPSY